MHTSYLVVLHQTRIKSTMSSNNNNEAPSSIDPPPKGEEGEVVEKPSSTGEPPKDNEEPESLTQAEAFLLVVSICVSEDTLL